MKRFILFSTAAVAAAAGIALGVTNNIATELEPEPEQQVSVVGKTDKDSPRLVLLTKAAPVWPQPRAPLAPDQMESEAYNKATEVQAAPQEHGPKNICERTGGRKIITDGGRSWRCLYERKH